MRFAPARPCSGELIECPKRTLQAAMSKRRPFAGCARLGVEQVCHRKAGAQQRAMSRIQVNQGGRWPVVQCR